MRLPRALTPHTIHVRIPVGEGAHGTVYGEWATIRHVLIEDQQRKVVDADGAEVVSSGRVILNPVLHIPPGTQVRVWPGSPFERECIVVNVSRYDVPGTPQHLELNLT